MLSSSATLTPLSLDSLNDLETHTPWITAQLVGLGLNYDSSEVAFLAGLDLSSLRKLSITPAQITSIITTLSVSPPPIRVLKILCLYQVDEEDIQHLDELLQTSLCAGLTTLILDGLEFDEYLEEKEAWEVFSKFCGSIKERGVVLQVKEGRSMVSSLFFFDTDGRRGPDNCLE